MDALLRPRSVAIIGASATPGSLGDCVVENLENAKYSGELYLVNPKRPIVRGRHCLGSITDLPPNIDCAVLAVPNTAVLPSAKTCVQRGVRSLIVFSAGFAETGNEGEKDQRKLAEIARSHNIILQGPNCLGMVNYVDRIPLTFVNTTLQEKAEAPGAAIISQSGALAAVIAVNMRHHKIPLTYLVSTGNEAVTGVEDFVEHFISQQSTRVLALIVEQFRQPKRFLGLARRARELDQYIVLLHPGGSDAGRACAATHTGAIAGNYDVMRTLVRHSGVVHVESMEELVDVSQILVRCANAPPRVGTAVVTESGAFKAVTLDLCERTGLELPSFSSGTRRQLKDVLPEFIPVSNPLDLTAQALVDPTLYQRTLSLIFAEHRFGSVLLGIILTDEKTAGIKLPVITNVIRELKPDKTVIFAALDEGAPFDLPEIDELRELGVACFPSPERALRALAHVSELSSQHECRDQLNDLKLCQLQRGLLPEYKSKQILAKIGISIPRGGLVQTVDEAIRISHEIGFPVVLKAQAIELSHKSDMGGVFLSLESEEAVRKAWSELHGNVNLHAAGVVLEGVLVERMAEKGVELIAGVRNDPHWGPVLLVGFGGVLAEVMGDVRLLPSDLPSEAIEKEINQLRCSRLLHGFRGSPELDIGAAAKVVSTLGRLVCSNPEISEIDINPLAVYAKGRGTMALDALISVGDGNTNCARIPG